MLLTLFVAISCQNNKAPQTVNGIVMDASMDHISIVTSTGDTIELSITDTDPARVPGVLLNDSVQVTYTQEKADNGSTVCKPTDLTITAHSPYFYLPGRWVEPIPGMEGLQGVELQSDGTAASINMATLQFSQWMLDISNASTPTLMLSYESIGNGQTISGTDTLSIAKLDADSLILLRKGQPLWRLARQR